MAIKLGKLTEQAINLDFPECWQSLATILGLKVEYDKTLDKVVIEVGLEDVIISKDNSIETSLPLNKEIISQIIIEAAKQAEE